MKTFKPGNHGEADLAAALLDRVGEAPVNRNVASIDQTKDRVLHQYRAPAYPNAPARSERFRQQW